MEPNLLEGFRVLSFCHYLQGPAATQYLADMGADVIKVEPPDGAFERHWSGANSFVGGVSAFFLSANRNKRSLAIDLKHPQAREVIERLIDHSDAIVENFRPGVLDRLGFGYDAVRARKPAIIYASASGFGADGPLARNPGQDLLVQARSGLIAATGDYDNRPTPVGNAAVDQHGAALLAMGVLGAYVRLLRTGQGTRVETSLLNAGIDLQTEPLVKYFAMNLTPEVFRRDPHLATWYHAGPYGVYRLTDCFVALSFNAAEKLGAAVGSDRIAALAEIDPYEQRDLYARTVAEELATRRLDDIAAGLDANGIWYARVNDYDDLLREPQVRHNGVFHEVTVEGRPVTLVNHPIRYDRATPGCHTLALRPGQHSRVILSEIGFSEREIGEKFAARAVFGPPDAAESSASAA